MRRFVLIQLRIYTFIILLLASLFLPITALAKNDEVNLIADEIVFEKETNLFIGKGSVDVQYKGMRLLGDRVEINSKTGEGVIIGDVRIEGKGSRISGDKFIFNIHSDRGIIFNASGFASPVYYFSGDMIERITEDRLRIHKGTMTTCARDCPEERVPWEFRSTKTNLQIEQYAKFQNPTFRVLGFPVFYFPYGIASIKTKRSSGFLMPEIGSNNGDGFIFNNLYFWAINDHMDATFGLDYLSRRGTRYNFQYRYMLSEKAKGEFNGYYFKDGEFFNQSISNNSIFFDDSLGSGKKTHSDDEYYIILYNHDQEFKNGTKGLLQIDLENQGTDNFSREFFNDLEYRSRKQADSFLSLIKNWETRSLDFETKYIESVGQDPEEIFARLPSLRFINQSEKIRNTPLFFQLDSSLVSFHREQNNDKTDVFRGDLFPQVSLPLTKLPWFTITPSVGFRETAYSRQEEENKGTTREFFVGGVSFEGPTSYRIFDASFGDIVKIKHIIEPRLSYSYVSDSDDEINNNINQFDGIDSFSPSNTLTYSLTNRILAKEELGKGEFETREILRFAISNSFNITTSRDPAVPYKRSLSDIGLDLDTQIFRNLKLDLDANYSIEGDKFSSANSWFKYSLKDLGYFEVETRFSQDALTGITGDKYFIGGAGFNYFKNWEFEYNIRYDDKENQTDESYYRVKYKSQCWALEFNIIDRPEDTEFFFLVTLVGIGDIGKGFQLSTFQRGLSRLSGAM